MTIKATPVLCSSRLILRPWRDQDSPEFARLNSDPAVTASLAKRPTRWESDALVERIRRHFQEHGFGLWAVEVRDRVPFIGFIGLAVVSFSAHFTPALRLAGG